MPSYLYSHSHYKDKTVSRLSYHYNGNHYTMKEGLNIETVPCVLPTVCSISSSDVPGLLWLAGQWSLEVCVYLYDLRSAVSCLPCWLPTLWPTAAHTAIMHSTTLGCLLDLTWRTQHTQTLVMETPWPAWPLTPLDDYMKKTQHDLNHANNKFSLYYLYSDR